MTNQKGAATIIWLVILAVLVIAGGAYFYMKPAGTAVAPEPESAASASGSYTVEELIARGENVTCTFAFNGGNSETTGTVYVGNGSLRGDYRTEAHGQTFVSHVVVKNNTASIWVDGMTEGFTSDVTGQVQTGGGSSAPDINSKLDYTCAGWTVDESMFALPSGVNFRTAASIPMPS